MCLGRAGYVADSAKSTSPRPPWMIVLRLDICDIPEVHLDVMNTHAKCRMVSWLLQVFFSDFSMLDMCIRNVVNTCLF
jgi:hypothetical protein